MTHRKLALSLALFATSTGVVAGIDGAHAAPRPCDQIIADYRANNYGWWWGALGHCKTGPGGITDPIAIFDCAWVQIPVDDQQACLRAELQAAPNTAQGIVVVSAYNAAPGCQPLISKYSRTDYRWWRGAIDHCKTGPGGVIAPAAIFDCAFAQVPAVEQRQCLRDALQVAPVTAPAIANVISFNTPTACPVLVAQYQQQNHKFWWRTLGNLKVGRAGLKTTDEIFAAAFAQIPSGDQFTCLRDYLKAAPVTALGIAEVRAYNGVDMAVADNLTTQSFTQAEDCEDQTGALPAGYFEPQMPAHLSAGVEGRLEAELRKVAQVADPVRCALPLSANTFAQAQLPSNAAQREVLLERANALADLAVTGRKAFAAFQQAKPELGYCLAIMQQPIAPGCPTLATNVTAPASIGGCEVAVSRAYRVANFLRTEQAVTTRGPWFATNGARLPGYDADRTRKQRARANFGWIAVSGEDDLPHRPVNVPSSDFPQFERDVVVRAPMQWFGMEVPFVKLPIVVRARYTIAQSNGPGLTPPAPVGWALAPEHTPSIPRGSKVVFFLHGMDSRAEEANDITRELFARMALRETNPLNLVVIAVDLPTSGYTETLDYTRVSPLIAMGNPIGLDDFNLTGHTPLLDFYEDFVVELAEDLQGVGLFDARDVQTVMGGSLGGSLSFRLGRRPGLDWLPTVVAWSPASVWDSLGSTALGRLALRTPWAKANDRSPADLDDLSVGRLGRRDAFFDEVWDSIISVVLPFTQPTTWFSSVYPCKDSAIKASRFDRHETYDPRFLTWRWRLATEQLAYSHHTVDPWTGQPRFMANDKRMLLVCGQRDNWPGANICHATRETALDMTLTPGEALVMMDTGHALDNERPRFFAGKLDDFLMLH